MINILINIIKKYFVIFIKIFNFIKLFLFNFLNKNEIHINFNYINNDKCFKIRKYER